MNESFEEGVIEFYENGPKIEDIQKMMQAISECPQFEELLEAPNEHPEKLTELMEFIKERFPDLHDHFANDQDQLLAFIDHVDEFEEIEPQPTENEEPKAKEETGQAPQTTAPHQDNLTEQDRQNIQSVGL